MSVDKCSFRKGSEATPVTITTRRPTANFASPLAKSGCDIDHRRQAFSWLCGACAPYRPRRPKAPFPLHRPGCHPCASFAGRQTKKNKGISHFCQKVFAVVEKAHPVTTGTLERLRPFPSIALLSRQGE